MSAGVGVDASQVQVGLYNRNLQGSGFSATVGDIMKLGLPSGSVDMAGGYSVLHHLFNYYDAIDEITRVLKPGGILYIDFEPNSLFKRLFDLPIRLRRALLDHAKFGNDDLENLAEYHNNFAPGISRKKLLQRLAPNYQILETGSRIPDLAVAPVLRALSKVSFVFSPCFFVLARKAA
jgi:ubiquinone/menaquinone biosynthesis C-methylase UbiE